MTWKEGSWNPSSDGSAMKHTDTGDELKTERISSTERPHYHDIVKVDKPSGTVKEIAKGKR